MTVCVYNGLNDHPRRVLRAQRTTTNPRLIRRIESFVSRLPKPADGNYSCPLDLGNPELATFGSRRRVVTLAFAVSGCGFVDNGHVTRWHDGLAEVLVAWTEHPRS